MQESLFDQQQALQDVIEHQLPGALLLEYPRFLDPAAADHVLRLLIQEIPWRQDSLRIAGKVIPVPRLQCWMGDRQSEYGYSGMRLKPSPWHEEVSAIRSQIKELTGISYNSVLLNYYRNGQDSVAWHADDEKELGPRPQIAALSLGAERPFEFRPKPGYSGDKRRLLLRHGSLVVMGEDIQRRWLHQIPKVKGLEQARVSLTFRNILG